MKTIVDWLIESYSLILAGPIWLQVVIGLGFVVAAWAFVMAAMRSETEELHFWLILPVLWFACGGVAARYLYEPPTQEQLFIAAHGPRSPELLFQRDVKSVSYQAGARAVLTLESRWQHSPPTATAGEAMLKLGQWIVRHPGDRIPSEQVLIDVKQELTDRYGAKLVVSVLRARWDRAELEKVSWDTVTSAHLIGLAQAELVHPAVRADVLAHCASGQLVIQFCRRAPWLMP
jgi:hypothetical protein